MNFYVWSSNQVFYPKRKESFSKFKDFQGFLPNLKNPEILKTLLDMFLTIPLFYHLGRSEWMVQPQSDKHSEGYVYQQHRVLNNDLAELDWFYE